MDDLHSSVEHRAPAVPQTHEEQHGELEKSSLSAATAPETAPVVGAVAQPTATAAGASEAQDTMEPSTGSTESSSKALSNLQQDRSVSDSPAVPEAEEITDDEAFVAAIWGGAFPVVCNLDNDEMLTYDAPAPIYLLVPRVYYFSSVLYDAAVFEHFTPHVDAAALPSDMWLSSSDGSAGRTSSATAEQHHYGARVDRPVPLRWHIPAGVLYDSMRVAQRIKELEEKPESAREKPLFGARGEDLIFGADIGPWSLEAHFQQFPKETVMRLVAVEYLDGEVRPSVPVHGQTTRRLFFNSLKEALYIRQGDSSAVNKLSVDASDALWEAVCKQDSIAFAKASGGKLASEPGRLRRVPLRVFVNGSFDSYFQEPVLPYDANGEARKLGDVLNEVLRVHGFENQLGDNMMCPVIHGVAVPLDTPVVWLANYMCHPDQFIYIALALRQL